MDETYYNTLNRVMNNLNNGLTWDDIEKTNYENVSPSEFGKFLFKIRNNMNLLELSKRLPIMNLVYDTGIHHDCKYQLIITTDSNDGSY